MLSPTPDRAAYLARVLISRLRQLEIAALEDDPPARRESAVTREGLVAKVLAVEAGVTDGATVQLVASALPPVSVQRSASDRDVSELAAFLRARLKI